MSVTHESGMAEAIDVIVRRALEEDLGTGDVTSMATIEPTTLAAGRFTAKEDGVLSGTSAAGRVFELVDPAVVVKWTTNDGRPIRVGDTVGEVTGNARAILTAERTSLNILQRMSGIATLTARMVAEVESFGTRILDTRKTAPGLRLLDKLAVVDGGGLNHRFGLYDMILIKDNHIAACGSIHRALHDAAAFRDRSEDRKLSIEIEARNLDQVREIVAYWEKHGIPDRILLDNMARRRSDGRLDTTILRQAVSLIGGRIETEASGNVELSTVAAIAATGVDYVSSGSLTHSARALDISLEFLIDPTAVV